MAASFAIVILCVIVMMQMLGVPLSLWDMSQEYEERSNSTIGWAMPSALREFMSMPSWFGTLPFLVPATDPLLVRSLFHPPR
jgi:hypothetical protein